MRKILNKLYDFSSSWTGTIIIVLLVIFFFVQAFVIPSGSMKNTLLIGDHLFVKKFSYGVPTPRIPWLEVKVLPELNNNGHLITGAGPKRGDIVVFRYPYDEKMHYVKRCFATSEDEIIFIEKQTFLRPSQGDEYISSNYDAKDIVTLNGKLFVREPYKFSGIHYDTDVNLFDQMVMYLNAGKLAMKPIIIPELEQNKNYPFNAFYFKVPKDSYFMMGDNRDHSSDSRFWGAVDYKFIVGKPWFVYFSWDSEYKIRWERIGRLVDTIQNDEKFTKYAVSEGEVDGLH
ncbi:signal peptidase I [Campylobacter sp. faydin G-24]|uniref:Signal peptidase I n=1 Tax=Campylobacter anatolicus TaxID=2829105 RepID=A0ABS5HL53_9BACT|nr:signal peptidase I [Campylobacter anatolicus]MBR8461965.1 signal peptidase I [Campylobacter anatolicus]MBR8464362.1 signal peptidase I [Campylobacter anatolicus]MBR8464946.1 signal peptidase I [Campylobacter anatolicus]